jgi:hypothetical protein
MFGRASAVAHRRVIGGSSVPMMEHIKKFTIEYTILMNMFNCFINDTTMIEVVRVLGCGEETVGKPP